jgi:alpha-1,3-rhamnosyltransferase
MNINNDLITVIIPAYNHEKYVQAAIRSAINQTYQNLELIIVDDGSTDSTWKKINEFKEECENRFVRIIFRKQENQGTIKTLDQTLYEAIGKYIYYIASDDIAYPNAIEVLYKNIGNAGLIFPDLSWIDDNGKVFFLDENREKTYDQEKAKYKTIHQAYTNIKWPNIGNSDFDFYPELLKKNSINIGFLLLKQAAIDAGGWDNDVIIEDYYMYLQVAKRYKIKRLERALLYYRQHNSNRSNNTLMIKEGIKRVFMNEKKYCYDNGYKENWDRLFKKRYFKKGTFWKKLKIKINNFIYKILRQ